MRRVQRSNDLLTVEQFEALDDDGRYRLELVRGRVFREPWPGELHGTLIVRLGHHLYEFVEARGLGRVVSDTGVVTERAPDSLRVPDLAFTARNRMNRYPSKGALRKAPDLCIEILSPSNRPREMRQKVFEFLDAGAKLVWVIDPQSQRVTQYRSKSDIRIIGSGGRLDGLDVLPGFELELSRLLYP